jgi:hypothetical protein
MAHGKGIVVASNPRGIFLEGIISGTPKPGTMMQVQAGTDPVAGRFTYEVYNPSADGDPRPVIVLLPDANQGGLETAAYVSGTRGFLYVPFTGEEINMLVKDLVGTGDTHAIGDRLKGEHGSGKLIAEATSANNAPFTLLEKSAALTADTLLMCMRN